MARIANAKLAAVLLHDLGDRWVVHVRNLREEVVFDLEVEAAEIPRQDSALLREVDRRLDLVDGPFAMNAIRGSIHDREGGRLDAVGELKHYAHRHAEGEGGHEEKDGDDPERMKEGRDHERP